MQSSCLEIYAGRIPTAPDPGQKYECPKDDHKKNLLPLTSNCKFQSNLT